MKIRNFVCSSIRKPIVSNKYGLTDNVKIFKMQTNLPSFGIKPEPVKDEFCTKNEAVCENDEVETFDIFDIWNNLASVFKQEQSSDLDSKTIAMLQKADEKKTD